jgi:hypothetical protein
LLSACLDADRVTRESRWYSHATQAFEWFLGRNALGVSMYDKATGGCRDGLHIDRLNENQGAESTLAYVQSLLEMRQFAAENQVPLKINVNANGKKSGVPAWGDYPRAA